MSTEEVTEHAILFSGGGMLVRPNDPEVERIFPLGDWIHASTRHGGRVFRRVITVVEDWTEVPQ